MADNNHAIVIGIDSYDNPDFNLGGAVQDALDFATWAIEAGGVPPQNVTLLLSSLPGVEPDIPAGIPGANVHRATRADINVVLNGFTDAGGRRGKRLYVYYAGHGSSAPGITSRRAVDLGASSGPWLIPSDFKSLEESENLPIGLESFWVRLAPVPPREQVFFFDACRNFLLRDLLTAAASQAGALIRRSRGQSNQYILYATTVGKVAQQKGSGVFGEALLEGLRGGLGAAEEKQRSQPPYSSYYEVRFSALAQYVKDHVTTKVQEQTPIDDKTPGATDLVLAEIEQKDIPRLALDVYVDPNEALHMCDLEVSIRKWNAPVLLPGGKYPPPTTSPTTLNLLPNDVYFVKANAPDYRYDEKRWDPTKPPRVNLRLKKVPARRRPPRMPPGLDGGPGGPLERAALLTPKTGRLDVRSEDEAVLIGVRSASRQAVRSGSGHMLLPDLRPGSYRVTMSFPEGGGSKEQIVEVKPGETTRLVLPSPAPELGRSQLEMLRQLDIRPDPKGYLRPSESIGYIAQLKLASLLGFAALAAHWPDSRISSNLKEFGVTSLNDLLPGASGALVLLGVSGDKLLKARTGKQLLEQSEVLVVGSKDEILSQSNFSRLSRFPAAAQFSTPLLPGATRLELRLPGQALTRYPVVALPDRVSVLIVVARDDGQFDVQTYILPLRNRPIMMQQELLAHLPSNIRRLELAQRYYTYGQEIPRHELGDLLDGKWLDPLLGCLAGYSLVRAGQPERYIGQPLPDNQPPPERPGRSAMQNMLRFFPNLPDSHVLAGLCQPEKRDEHFADALARGIPIFSEGFKALYAWATEKRSDIPDSLSEVAHGLLPGSPWTAWSIMRPVLLFSRGSFGTVPGGWEILEKKRKETELAARSVGRVNVIGDAVYPWVGTAFLVGPDIAVTSRHSVKAVLDLHSQPARLKPSVSVRVDFGMNPDKAEVEEYEVTELIGMGKEGNGPDPFAGDYALLRLSPKSLGGRPLPQPLQIAARAPEPIEGRNVCVIGYPARDPRADAGLTQRAFSDVYGVKRLQPGEVIDVDAESKQLHHDCFTLGGNAGSPVIDLETMQVLGLHVGGRTNYKGYYKYNYALALWLLAGVPLFREAGVRFAR